MALDVRFASVSIYDSLGLKTYMLACGRNYTTVVEEAEFGKSLVLSDSETIARCRL